MKKSRFTDAQIMGVLRQAEGGVAVPELCREHGISTATFCKCRDHRRSNAVRERLERTHSEFAGKGAPLNQSHRARYLLNGLLRCGCCGGGFTIIGKDRYGCYRRKTQGKQECANTRTVSRQKLEDRVLARLRQGVVTPAFAARFAAEVERLTLEGAQHIDGRKGTIQAILAKVDAAIERLLDRLETGNPARLCSSASGPARPSATPSAPIWHKRCPQYGCLRKPNWRPSIASRSTALAICSPAATRCHLRTRC